MLVTQRRCGESILIGSGVEVKVLEVGPTWVKLGVAAPRDVPVVRKEVRLVMEQNLAASRAVRGDALGDLVRRLRVPAGSGPALVGTDAQTAPAAADMRVEGDASGIRSKGEPGTGKTPGCIPHRT